MESIRIDNEEGQLLNSRTEFGANSVPRVSIHQPTDNRSAKTRCRQPQANDEPVRCKKRCRTESETEIGASLISMGAEPTSDGSSPVQQQPDGASVRRDIQSNATEMSNSDSRTESNREQPDRNLEIGFVNSAPLVFPIFARSR